MSSAQADALIHAARYGCEPAIPLVQPETIISLKPPGILAVECPAACGASFPVPVIITDTPSISSEKGELSVRFVAEAPELHDHIYKHLRTCPSARSWVDAALHEATGYAGPKRG